MTSFISRRRLFRTAVVSAVGGAVLAAGTGGAFAASPPAAAALHTMPAGTMRKTADPSQNPAVVLPPPLPTLNFIGSIVVKVVVGGSDFVRLQVLDDSPSSI